MDPAKSFSVQTVNKNVTDCSSICDEQLPLAHQLAKSQKTFNEALDIIFQLEKVTRSGSDMISSSRVLLALVNICVEQNMWEKLNECIPLVTCRQQTLKQAVGKMIQRCMECLEKCPNKETKLKLIETLRTVTEGKIFVEVERARLTKMLADIKESEGDISGAAAIMGELKVESYGSMEKREKVELILEQMRLYVAKQDFETAKIVSKQIGIRYLDSPKQEELKLKFYNLKIVIDRDSDYLKTSQHYQAIGTCTCVPESQQERMMRNAVLYCILAPYGPEQQTMIHHLMSNKYYENIPLLKALLEVFTSKELIKPELFFREFGSRIMKLEVFNDKTSHGRKCWNELKERIVEHNILVISKYYTKIYLKRMSELISVPMDKSEEYISKLVNSGTISVKIDRPKGIVHFTKQTPGLLNEWASNMGNFMCEINKTYHLVNKEAYKDIASHKSNSFL